MLLDMYGIIPFEKNVALNYNVAPTQTVMVVKAAPDKKRREAELSARSG
jgi:putative SOS response-associated peptidase YedK